MTFRGFTVLDTRPDRPGAADEMFARSLVVSDPGTGKVHVDQRAAAPANEREVVFVLRGAGEIAAFMAFLDARLGVVMPFWLPTMQRDLMLSEDLKTGETDLHVQWVGYAADLYPQSRARHHLALYEPHLTMDLLHVIDATDTGGGTEELTLSAVAGRDYPATTTLVSFLRLVRLDEPHATLTWLSRDVVEASIKIRELPMEVPA